MQAFKFNSQRRRILASVGIIIGALSLTYAPIPGVERTIVVVGGTELQAPLEVLAAKFEQQNPTAKLQLKFQGSQDIVNNYVNQKNDFKPTVLIPANGEILEELASRLQSAGDREPFYNTPQPIAKTILVGIAWPERGKVLFPNGRFQWLLVEQAMQAGNWEAIGGSKDWGSFDFVTTDPTRSNSGQITLTLWAQSKLGSSFNNTNLSSPTISSLFNLIKRSVYQAPRSTDILLQEFIAKGPNDADVATVYESVAIYRFAQAATSFGKPYQIYYLDPTVETTATAAIVRRDVDAATAEAARKFVSFLAMPQQQAVFVQYGFRPINKNLDLKSVPRSPWAINISGVQTNPPGKILPLPSSQTRAEIQRIWEREN